ncbi:MAG: adenylate kinase [Bacteroidota bacterium]|nr:adenylate kinase [Bacteroidota bacterium]
MLNLVLFGPPGSGKGTQSAKLIEKYQLVHLSTGDILRAEIKAQTPLGIDAKTRIDKGELVPDEVVINMISNKLDQNHDAKGFIFDGFPRTTAQAEALDNLLKGKGTSISVMLALDVDDQELINRILLRGKDSGRADDQDLSIIENRIAIYNRETAVVADYYKAQGKLRLIHGVGSIDDIFASLCSSIENN